MTASGGWFDFINPFASKDEGMGSGGGDGPGPAAQRNMSLRPITMKDFEVAVNKLKEARAHCGSPTLLRERMELD